MHRALLLSFGVLVGCGPGLSSAPQGGSSSEGGVAPTTSAGSSAGATGVAETTSIVEPGGTGSSTHASTSGGSTHRPSSEDSGGTVSFPTDGGPGQVLCDTWGQDCPPGEKCTFYAHGGGFHWDATKCVPVMENPAQPGEPCFVVENGVSGIDNCDLGSFCWDTNAENLGTCVEMCKGRPAAPICDPGYFCVIYSEGIPNFCEKGCDPLLQDCAIPGDLCIAGWGIVACALDASGDQGQLHDPCEYLNECDPALACVDSASAVECDPNQPSCCEPYCDLNLPNTCPGAGQVCKPFWPVGEVPPGYENLGYCSVPG